MTFIARWHPWLVFIGAVALQLIAFDPRISPYDEGVILVGAERVLRGDVPYRDFWTLYGPGQFFLISWLFSVFGPTDLVVRAVGIVAKAAITGLAYVTVTRAATRSRALVAALVVLGLLIVVRHDPFPLFPALALSMAAILLVERGLKRELTHLVHAGICTGLATTFRHDLGAYGFIAIGASICFVRAARGSGWSIVETAHSTGRLLGRYVAGVLIVLVPVFGLFLHAVPVGDLYECLIETPLRIYPRVRSTPFPRIGDLTAAGVWQPENLFPFVVYLPFLVSIWVVALAVRRRHTDRTRRVPQPRPVREDAFLVFLVTLTACSSR